MPELHDDDGIPVGESADEFVERQGRRQYDQGIISPSHGHLRRAPGAADTADAWYDRHGEARTQAHEQMHERPIEERVALAQERHIASGLEMRGDCGGAFLVEVR